MNCGSSWSSIVHVWTHSLQHWIQDMYNITQLTQQHSALTDQHIKLTSFIALRPSFCGCWTTCNVHGTVYLSSSLTACHFSPSRNISRLTYLAYLFRAQFDCVKCPCSSLGHLRRYNFVKLHYITLELQLIPSTNCLWSSWQGRLFCVGSNPDLGANIAMYIGWRLMLLPLPRR